MITRFLLQLTLTAALVSILAAWLLTLANLYALLVLTGQAF